MKIKLFLTFDHELPLGKLTTSYNDALFSPSDRVMQLAEQLGVKVTFFTDILCALRYKDWDLENFYEPYVHQLESMLKRGHDVQLHIHPHWLTSDYVDNCFVPSSDFSLSDFKNHAEFGGISGIITLSSNLLSDLCQKVKNDYSCIAFRAGGYNVQPETEMVFKALYQSGIRYDSSIARGYYYKSHVSEVDFTRLPKKCNWIIDPQNIEIEKDGEGVLEVPILSIPKKIFEIPTAFKMKRMADRKPISHGEVIHEVANISLKNKLRMMMSDRMVSFDNYTLTSDYLLKSLDYHVRRFDNSEQVLLSVIAHPKSMGDYSFDMMQQFIEKVRNKYPDVEFSTFAKMK